MNEIYVVTASGVLIDTICEVFKTNEEATRFLQKMWDDTRTVCGDIQIETICPNRIWKTNDSLRQKVKWQIHKRTLMLDNYCKK